MKFSAAAALVMAIAPLALAKKVNNVYPIARSNHNNNKGKGGDDGGKKGSGSGLSEAALLAELGLISSTDVVIIWVNQGNGQATQTINPPQTVTVTAGPGGAAGAEATASTTSSASASTSTIQVTVGGKGLAFEPNEIHAPLGSMVVFTFMNKNHTVTQSAFDTPCQPLEGGMDSGFQANPNNTVNPPPQVAMQIMKDTPLWFYCKQKGHCGQGMVMSINPNAEKTQAKFQSLAIAQNGEGSTSPIAGGAPDSSASPAAPPAAGDSTSATTSSSSSATNTAQAGSAAETGAAGGITTGTGSLDANGACACVVQCSQGAFPAAQAQGVGAFGGFAGAIPQSMVAM